jgi:hypothetical protein
MLTEKIYAEAATAVAVAVAVAAFAFLAAFVAAGASEACLMCSVEVEI